jgi:hypothetical protein
VAKNSQEFLAKPRSAIRHLYQRPAQSATRAIQTPTNQKHVNSRPQKPLQKQFILPLNVITRFAVSGF